MCEDFHGISERCGGQSMVGEDHAFSADAVRAELNRIATNLAQPGGYRIGLFLYHYPHGRYAGALAEARRVNAPTVLYGHVVVATAPAELGHDDAAADAVAEIRGLDPDYGTPVAAGLRSCQVAPEVVSLIVAGLEKAGLPIAAPAQDAPAS
jgi:hypothetical protein